jgi:hypothetical protein
MAACGSLNSGSMKLPYISSPPTETDTASGSQGLRIGRASSLLHR